MGLDVKAAKVNMVWREFEPKPWEETDVDIKASYCGIRGTNLHTLRNGWWPTKYPCYVRYELVINHVTQSS